MTVEQLIKQRAYDLGIDLIGFARARTLEHTRAHLEKRVKENRHTSLEWSNLEERVNPELLLPGVKTIITVGVSYYKEQPEAQGGLRGALSRSAWGSDYHQVLGVKLHELARFIEQDIGARAESFVDTGPPVDRAWAIEGGLGWSGKNCAVINPTFGSWVFLGSIFTDLELEADPPLGQACGECTLCLKTCPTGALREAGTIEPLRCVSYLTQIKGFVPREYRKLMGKQIYGCDACQLVCPANKQAAVSQQVGFEPDPEVVLPKLLDLLEMTNRQFKEHFGKSAAAWRGRTVLQRNALIALGNINDIDSMSALLRCLQDDRPVIRGHAAWALGELGMGEQELGEALEKEQDAVVREELRFAIDKLKGNRHNG